MKKTISGFFSRGLTACGFGPIILAILYLILQNHIGLEVLTVNQVCRGIFSITALAFLAGGINVIYQIERLPLVGAILIHGVILYIGYLATYLFNDWLEWGSVPVFMFSGIFIVCYLVIWVFIYFTTKKRTDRLNEMLKKSQQNI